MNEQFETVTFLIHAVKQFCFGFETLNEISDGLEDGSPAKAFYMTPLYNHIAVFYLLDRRTGDPIGGTFHKALKPLGLDDTLDSIRSIIETRIGSTTFGEIVRVFRNKVIVHTNYRDDDLNRIYAAADMQDPKVAQQFHDLLWGLYAETKLLPVSIIERLGLDPEDFGIRICPSDS